MADAGSKAAVGRDFRINQCQAAAEIEALDTDIDRVQRHLEAARVDRIDVLHGRHAVGRRLAVERVSGPLEKQRGAQQSVHAPSPEVALSAQLRRPGTLGAQVRVGVDDGAAQDRSLVQLAHRRHAHGPAGRGLEEPVGCRLPGDGRLGRRMVFAAAVERQHAAGIAELPAIRAPVLEAQAERGLPVGRKTPGVLRVERLQSRVAVELRKR